MKVLIIEDEYPAVERLTNLLLKAAPKINIVSVLDSVSSSVSFFENNEEASELDIIFSDIQLSDGLSFQIFETISDIHTPVIFTTAYDEYAIKAFKVKSIDYLLKPVKLSEVETALRKYESLKDSFAHLQFQEQLGSLLHMMNTDTPVPSYKNRFLVKSRDQLIPVHTDQIAYFYTSNEIVYLVHLNGKKYMVDFNLEQLTDLLNPNEFYRLNRQIISSLRAIEKIHPFFNGRLKLKLHPAMDSDIIVSREKAKAFKRWLGAEN